MQCVRKTSPLKEPSGVNLFVRETERRGQDNRPGGHRPDLVSRTGIAPHALRTNTNICFFWAAIGSSRTQPKQLSNCLSQHTAVQFGDNGGRGRERATGLVWLLFCQPSPPKTVLTPPHQFMHLPSHLLLLFPPPVWLDLSFQSVQLILPQRASILS